MYKTIYADPPWQICTGGKDPRWGTPQKHYNTMKTKDIIAMKEWLSPLVEEQAHLYMWVVNNKIEDALQVINAWGFKYISNMCWVKDRFGTGQYFRGQHELLFFCRKGNPLPYKHTRNISSIIQEKKTIHSRKPHIFYDVIEQISYPNYLELFARNTRAGWDSWNPTEGLYLKE